MLQSYQGLRIDRPHAETRARVWCQWAAFGPPMAWAAVRSGAVVLVLLAFCLLLPPLWESVIVLCFVVRYFSTSGVAVVLVGGGGACFA